MRIAEVEHAIPVDHGWIAFTDSIVEDIALFNCGKGI